MDFIQHATMLFKKHFNEERQFEMIQQNNITVLTNDDKKPYMVKYVSQTALHRLKFEQRMSAFLSEKLNLSLPKVIEIGINQTYAYMLREMVIGKPLSEVLINRDDHHSLIEASGQVLAHIHQTEMSSKGFVNEHLEVEEVNIFSQEEFDTLLSILMKHHLLTEKELSYLRNIPIDELFAIKPYVLCHADYHPNHIIIEQNKIVSIIDLEWMCAAMPFDDLATFHIFLKFLKQSHYIKDFYNGYEKIRKIDTHYFKHMDVYILYRLLTMVGYQLSLAKIEMEDFYQMALKEFKKHLKKMMSS